jgi:hypothetical protein
MNMKKLALAAGVALTAVAATASAQYYQRDDGYRNDWRRGDSECWNPRAGHFEQVRPGESQGDLDMSRCRQAGDRGNDRNYDRSYNSDRRDYRESREECWNPRARHFEEVRRDERQDDLDFSRCRVTR